MDRHGLLFNVLRDNINALSITGGPFFDAARLAVMKEALGEVRDGGDETAAAQEGQQCKARFTLLAQDGGETGDGDSVSAHIPLHILKHFSLCSHPDGKGGRLWSVNIRLEFEVSGDTEDERSILSSPASSKSSSVSSETKRGRESDSEDSSCSSGSPKRQATTKAVTGRGEEYYADGTSDFEDTPETPDTPTHDEETTVADIKHNDEDDKSQAAIEKIKTAIKECLHDVEEEGGGAASAGRIAGWFSKNRELLSMFKNRNLSTKASNNGPQRFTNAYVFVPGILENVKTNVSLDDIKVYNKAKYMYSDGDRYGSLKDLVMGGTPFPIPEDRIADVWGI